MRLVNLIVQQSKFLVVFIMATSWLLADITGTVYKDFDFNGVYEVDNGDAPVIGVNVQATCEDGSNISATTDTNGSYTISGFETGKKCRIEVDPSSAGVGSGSNAKGGNPLVDIVADGATHDVSTGSPATYCQANPDVVLVVLPGYYTEGKNESGGGSKAPTDFGTVFTFKNPAIGVFNDNDTIGENRTEVQGFADTGSVWGAAWKKGTKDLFVSAVLKRYVPLAHENTADEVKTSLGQIYKIHFNDDNTTTMTNFHSITDTISDEAAGELVDRDYGENKDRNASKYASMVGLGDLDISEDESKLYTINLHTKELVILNAEDGKIIRTVAIPNPYDDGKCADDMVRPWALKVRGSNVYIGSVCADQIIAGDAEGYGDDDRDEPGLGAAIQQFNADGFKTIAVTNTLTYLKPRTYNPKKEETKWSQYFDLTVNEHAPLLTDIEFDNNGNLILGYTSLGSFNRFGSLNGDIRRMCLNTDGSYTDENTAAAPTDCASHEVTYKDNDHTYYEFYVGDYFYGELGEDGHPETASGSLAQAPGNPNIIVGMVDATDWYQPGAIGLFSHESGDKIAAQAVIDNRKAEDGGEREPYGAKAGGMGDVELLCDPAPIEVGNYVWMDINEDGIQDSNEPPMSDVNVTLNCNDTEIGTATTDKNGHYYFGGIDNTNLTDDNTIKSGEDCKLSIAQSDVNEKEPTEQNPNADANDTIDNDAAADGDNNVITFTTTSSNDHSLDFGIAPAFGCATGTLFEDVDGDGSLGAGDSTAPEGITVIAEDAYGNSATAVTDENGTFVFAPVIAGRVTISIDTTDADIPDGALWDANATKNIVVSEGTVDDGTCSTDNDFPYILPAPVKQDPKDIATCAQPTSITWEGAEVGSASDWNSSEEAMTTAKTFATAGGAEVEVTMQIVNDDDSEFNNASSGTSAAFGEPYLTLYLGDQSTYGDGDYNDSTGMGCSAHGYDLESGESYQLEVTFSEPVILDNWRLRDVDSGDVRADDDNWEWQDGIIVTAEDAEGNAVEIDTKIGDSGKGLIKDENNILHTDKDHYDAGGGDFITGDGTTPNATNGHIVLTSNFKTISKLVITHVAGPDVPCQTRSALAMAGLAVCKPLHIKGTVYDDEGGAYEETCDNDDSKIDGEAINSIDGKPLNVCLLDENNVVIDTQAVNDDGTYDFASEIHPETDYEVLLTTKTCVVGSGSPGAELSEGWINEAEAGMSGPDEDTNGIVDVFMGDSDSTGMDFAINKKPVAQDYTRESEINKDGSFDLFTSTCHAEDYISDVETSTDDLKIQILSISGGSFSSDGTDLSVDDIIDGSDICDLKVDPNDGDTIASLGYKVIDGACRESDVATFKAPFTTISISGKLFLDMERNDKVDGNGTSKSCDDTTALYINLIDSDNKVLASTEIGEAGSYAFYNADGISADTNYTLILSQTQGSKGDDAPSAQLPAGCANLDGENIESLHPESTDGTADGKIAVSVESDNITEINFAITPLVKIGDRVWIEDDNDGNASTGNITAVENTTVTATCNGVDYNATTNNDGLYAIEVPVNIGECTVSVPTPADAIPSEGSDDNSVDDTTSENDMTHDNNGTTVTVGTVDNLTLDFGFTNVGSWSGNVSKDTNNDDAGDENLSNVEIKLYQDTDGDGAPDGDAVATTTTDDNGNYIFENLTPGDYVAVETQPDGLDDVSEHEGGADNDDNGNAANNNQISGTVDAGENDANNDFVEEEPGSWSGNVSKDTNNDDAGDENLSNVEIKLYQDTDGDGAPDGDAVATTTTDDNGNYIFENLTPGDYVAVETQPDGLDDVSEHEGGADNDDNGNAANNNQISGTVDAGENDANNDFVEEEISKAYRIGDLFWVDANKNGVYDDGEVVIEGAVIELLDEDGNPVLDEDGNPITTVTDANGRYHFDVAAGTYRVKFNIPDNDKYKAYVFSNKGNAQDDETNKSNKNGVSDSFTVGGDGDNSVAGNNLRLDAGINCGCDKAPIQSNGGDALGLFTMLMMIFMTLTTGLFFVRKEEQKA
ncbi:hypothetical protein MNB_SV-3-619 [hydrothermal vent metagenome]|uniref:SD-repeat containing protein B domain-containing protein n=1 Tax=hydrothermal vent metagenome TaxID=652676 RepID=A0A1W1CVS8_9ZZZZ